MLGKEVFGKKLSGTMGLHPLVPDISGVKNKFSDIKPADGWV